MTHDRRGGVGFGGGRSPGHDDLDDEVESTRAMDLVDDLDQPTAMPARPMPPPPRTQPPARPVPPARPAPPPPRAAPPPPPRPGPPPPAGPPKTLHDPAAFGGEEEDATRMLDADSFAPAPAPAAAQAGPGTPIELRIVSGPDRGKVHRLQDGEHLVGRGLDCQIVLADPAVSRKHFRVVRRGDTVEIVDMGGANGTNVNGQRVSRQPLRTGDQIEIGTTVLEYFVVGAAVERERDFPKQEPAAKRPDAKPATKKSNTGLIIAIAGAGLVVLGGGAVAAWLVMGSSDDGGAPPVENVGPAEVGNVSVPKLIDQAKAMIEERDWAGAIDKLKAARKIAPDDSEAKGLLDKARDELDAEEALTEGKELIKNGDLAAAMARFKEVPNTSEQYSDAREELNNAREAFIRGRLAEARKAVETGDKAGASKAVKAILDLDDKHQEARLLQEQVDAMAEGAAAAPGASDDKAGGAKAAVGSAAAVAADAPKAEGGGNAKALFAQALTAYHNRQWSAADAAFGQIIDGSYPRKDQSKAVEQRASVKEVADGFQQGEGLASTPMKAAKAWLKAYQADKRVDGHHAPFLVKKVGAAYVAAADALYKAKRYADAAEAAREAMNYDPDSGAAMDIDDKCKEQAKAMLKEAERHLKEKNYATARDLAKKVSQILGTMDPDSAKARDIVLKATEASSGGEED